jgi:hypothetical protein
MWNLLPHERLRSWQSFRNTISDKSLDQALAETAHLWSYAPFVKNYLHFDFVDEWPNPWELIYDNYYCDLAKALAIVYTLYLSQHKVEIEIKVFVDPENKEQYNLVYVDKGKYVLNYIHDEVVNSTQVKKDLVLKKVISTQELKLEQLV